MEAAIVLAVSSVNTERMWRNARVQIINRYKQMQLHYSDANKANGSNAKATNYRKRWHLPLCYSTEMQTLW